MAILTPFIVLILYMGIFAQRPLSVIENQSLAVSSAHEVRFVLKAPEVKEEKPIESHEGSGH
ncbi:MAG: hypothetical protein R2865_13490 [Deinococcales bacterium]